MFFLGCTQRIIKYLLISIPVFSLQCLTTDDTDETSEESKEYLDNDFFRFTTRKRYIWEDWTVATHKPPPHYEDGGYSGGGDPMIFFIILGVGIIIFVGLLFLCKKARDAMPSPGSRSVPGTATHPPTAGAGGVAVTISTSNDPSQGRPGIFRQTSEKPPDYATVTLGDLSNAKSPFPSVMRQKSCETPPPKYDENNPIFK